MSIISDLDRFEFPIVIEELLLQIGSDEINKENKSCFIAAYIDGKLKDLSDVIQKPKNISFISANFGVGLQILRHSAAHLLANAILELYPNTKLLFGPDTESGFFYDFDFDGSITSEDLIKIEEKMREISSRKLKIERIVLNMNEAKSVFSSQTHKLAILPKLIGDITAYKQGEFIDLCKGPHVPNTSFIRHFALTGVSGVQFEKDGKTLFAQRVYGTAYAKKDDLTLHFKKLEDAKAYDHKKLGAQLELFHFQDDAVGQVFWHQKGWKLYRIIENYLRDLLEQDNYEEVKTPIFVSSKLWSDSGHLEKFSSNMIFAEIGGAESAVKPMSCPCHVQIYKKKVRSYKDLPIKMSEFGCCHRNESSGSMNGLMRVRGFNQDDGHIFCTDDQVEMEIRSFCVMLFKVYKKFGFSDVKVKFSTRPELRAGSDKLWDSVEELLFKSIKALDLKYELNPGEGAFYGPKLEFVLRDAMGRDWQCGTLQLDFVLPERLGATYIDADGQSKVPVMLHRAIIGTFERFIGILIEHYKGKFPFWLAPVQIVINTVSIDVVEYAKRILKEYQSLGFRVEIDCSNDSIGYKIRKYSFEKKIPLLVIIGKKEQDSDSVSLRLDNGKSLSMTIRESFDFLSDI